MSILLMLAAAAAAPPTLSAALIKQDVAILASDAFAGRGPGQPGEAKTIAHIAAQFEQAGLKPLGPNGSWYQDVPLVRFDRGPVTLSVTVGGTTLPLRTGVDVTTASRIVGRTSIDRARIVFAGYGVVAPGGWDPYAGLDLTGTVVLLLWGDPDVQAGRDLGFGGRAGVLAGRTGEKIAAARARGAIAVITVHEDFPASYPWSQVANADAMPGYQLDDGKPLDGGFGLRGAMRQDVAADLLRRGNLDYDAMKAMAQTPAFRAVAVGDATLSTDFETTATRLVSRNVVGLLPGTSRAAETVLYGAHWDANGTNAFDPAEDRIRNGAVDNATGTATLIEIARTFGKAGRQQRGVVFAAWTAEEKGLLGAIWYAGHPLRPLETTAAVFNLDPHVVLGRARNLDVIGVGRTPLEDDLRTAAAARGLRVDPEVNTEASWYFRSDHFAFAEKGVPTVYFRAGKDLVVGGLAAGEATVDAYNERCYHQPCDSFDPAWDMAGAAQEGEVAYDLGQAIADGGRWPGWNPGSAYATTRAATASSRK